MTGTLSASSSTRSSCPSARRASWLDKQQWIDRHDFFTYHELDVSEVDIRLFADTAILRAVQRNRAASHGHDVQVSTRVSHVWVRRADAWRSAGIQFSPLVDT
jgi:ketosteroid isomerase-like protein